MKIRGERRCQECGTQWSYYETGSVACPNCGSLRSVGTDDRKQHTDSPTNLDLTPARDLLDDGRRREAAERATERCREYVRRRGFIVGGDLQPLDDTYLAATELVHVAKTVGRAMRVDDEGELYFLKLVRGTDAGERPAPDDVPESLRAARGLAYANAVDEYRGDVRAYLDEHPDPVARDVLDPLGTQVKRVQALDGDVSPAAAERLVRIARNLGTSLIEDDEGALAEARDRLDRLDSII